MKNKLLPAIGLASILLLGAGIGIERRTTNPTNGQSHSEIRLLLPGQKPKLEVIPGGGTSFSTVRYAYGLLKGGFLDPNHIETNFEIRVGNQ